MVFPLFLALSNSDIDDTIGRFLEWREWNDNWSNWRSNIMQIDNHDLNKVLIYKATYVEHVSVCFYFSSDVACSFSFYFFWICITYNTVLFETTCKAVRFDTFRFVWPLSLSFLKHLDLYHLYLWTKLICLYLLFRLYELLHNLMFKFPCFQYTLLLKI